MSKFTPLSPRALAQLAESARRRQEDEEHLRQVQRARLLLEEQCRPQHGQLAPESPVAIFVSRWLTRIIADAKRVPL